MTPVRFGWLSGCALVLWGGGMQHLGLEPCFELQEYVPVGEQNDRLLLMIGSTLFDAGSAQTLVPAPRKKSSFCLSDLPAMS